MTTNPPNATPSAATQPMPTHVIVMRRGGRLKPPPPVPSREAGRLAATILEVLAGVRTPTDAAAALGIGVPRYYLLEQRALQGLVIACEPRPVGPGHHAERKIAALEKEVTRLKQDCNRQQALVRAAQRTIGLAPPATPKPATKTGGKAAGKDTGKAGRKVRKRRPTVRALTIAAALSAAADTVDSDGAVSSEMLQHPMIAPASKPAMPQPVVAAHGGG